MNQARKKTTNYSRSELMLQTRMLSVGIVASFSLFAALSLLIFEYSDQETPNTSIIPSVPSFYNQESAIQPNLHQQLQTVTGMPKPQVATPPLKPVTVNAEVEETKVPFKPKPGVQVIKVKRGDTLSTIFADLGIDSQTLEDINKLKLKSKGLKGLTPGQKLSLKINQDNQLQHLEVKVNRRENLIIKRVGVRYQATLERIIPQRKMNVAHARISHSMYESAKKAGIPEKLVKQLIDIYSWDIDFAKDIKNGDTVDLLYDSFNIDGEPAGVGDILYVKIKNNGKTYEAVRYTNPKGASHYYTPKGESLQKAFLRTPVKFGHISSYFNLSRMHPILHTLRAHRGVDYSAPRGTPVKSAGDGIVIFTGRKGGYGNTVIVKHSDTYETLYAHLDNFASRVRTGKSVGQGEIIGYVGSTGLATGPHLHYEFHVNGVHQNPLGAKLQHSSPLPKKYQADFKRQTTEFLAKVKQGNRG